MKKNILITTGGLSSVGQGGGISSYAHDLAENLVDAGHDVSVFLIKQFHNSAPENVKYKYNYFEVGDTATQEEDQIKKILSKIELLNPDVIINNDTSYIAGLWPVLKEQIIKISVMHGFSKSFTLNNSGITGKMACLNQEYLDYIICQNSLMTKNAACKYKVPLDKLIFIPQTANHIDINLKPKNKVFTIVYAGGENHRKGANEMNSLAKYLKESSLNFRLKWCLEADSFKLNFQNDNRFEFLGNLSRNNFYKTLFSSDCIIIPTHLDTGPMLLVEAMGQGVIPICNNLKESAIPDIIEHNKNGILIENNKPDLFFKFIEQLIKNPESQYLLKENAFNYFLKNLTTEKQIKRYEALFENKKSKNKTEQFSDKNIIYYHLKKTDHLPKYSLKRIKLKLTNTLELPMYKKK